MSTPPDDFAPPELTSKPQFVCWAAGEIAGKKKKTKIPRCADRECCASVSDPKTWSPFAVAWHAWQEHRNSLAGVAFVFVEGQGYIGFDIDNCLTADGKVKSWAKPLLSRLRGTYAEVSPSGTGMKAWCTGSLEPNCVHQFFLGDGQVERYARSRFFCLTGRRWQNAPLTLINCQAAIDYAAALADFKLLQDGHECL